MLNESILIDVFVGIFLLRKLESCAETDKAVNTNKENNIGITTRKQTILF